MRVRGSCCPRSGRRSGRSAEPSGLSAASPLSAVIGDQQASLFGQAGFDPGDAKCTFGTGSFLLLNTGTDLVRSTHGLITTVAHKLEGELPVYALEGSIAVAGALVQWCRDSLGLIRSAAETETHALTVDCGMTADNLLMQTIADVLDVPVVRPMVAETVALGAAYAAGLGVG